MAPALLFSSLIFIVLGILEMFFPVWFAWHEVLNQAFPNLYQYQYLIGSGEILLGALLIWPAYRKHPHLTHQFLETGFRVGLAIMFIGASLFKIHDPKNFSLLVSQYQFLPAFSVNFFALLLPVAEFLVGCSLLLTRFTRENSLLLLLMFLSFIIALANAVIRDLGIVCGCFVLEGAQDKTEAVISLVRDLVLLGPVLYLCTRPRNLYLWDIWRKKNSRN